ncbi:MAG TPA: DUF4405 domain-containing protein [Candidatus Cloacimonadota bacterium]|nr:DUF4405 domain-containing protein [Candidatus Cloacimonadota bacterium]
MKIKALKIVNPILALVFILIIVSLVWLKINGSETAAEMHELCGQIFGILAIVHIYLNWAWIKLNIFKIKNKK